MQNQWYDHNRLRPSLVYAVSHPIEARLLK